MQFVSINSANTSISFPIFSKTTPFISLLLQPGDVGQTKHFLFFTFILHKFETPAT